MKRVRPSRCGIRSQDVSYRAELLSGSEVCVGPAPHHLMLEITAQATQKAESGRNFLINLSSVIQKKPCLFSFLSIPPFSVCWIWREDEVTVLLDICCVIEKFKSHMTNKHKDGSYLFLRQVENYEMSFQINFLLIKVTVLPWWRDESHISLTWNNLVYYYF